jgi:peptidyl-prolyl cis-trans isomerase C
MRFAYAVSIAAILAFSAPARADEYVIMKVNNQDVSSAEVQHLWDGLFPAGQAPAFETVKPDVRERVLRAMMAEKLLYAEAIKQGADKSEKLQRELEDIKKKLVVRTFLDIKTADLITDADLKREYDAMVSSMKDDKEVRARHILTATEKEAKEAKKKLDSGKSFEEVARDNSKDPGSAKQGGDLGYFTKDKMVKEFADAAFSMKKGEVSNPVKSSFGYHIIKVEDVRKVTAPTFNEVKDQLRGKLQEKKLNDYIADLVKSADIKTFDAKGKEMPFNRNLAEPLAEQPKPAKVEEKKAEEKPAAKPEEKKAEEKPAAEAKPVKAEEKKVEEKKSDEKPAKTEEKKSVKAEEKKAEKPLKADEKKAEPAEKSEKAEKTN